MRFIDRKVLLSIAALSLLACASESEVTSDVAATELLPSPAFPEATGPWAVAEQPRHRIQSGSDIDLGDVAGVALLGSGEIIVATMRPAAVRVFDSTGRFLRELGRRGRGPGEFMSVDRLLRLGDTLLVFDLSDTAHRFLVSGEFLGTQPRTVGGALLHGVLAGGDRVIGELDRSGIPLGSAGAATERLRRVGTEQVQALGEFVTQSFRRDRDGEFDSDVFAPHNRVAVFENGFCAGYAGDRRIQCFDTSGSIIGEITLTSRTTVAVEASDREAFFSDVYRANAGAPKAESDAQIAALRERLRFASELGYFGRLLASRDGLLWVGPPSTDSYRWANPYAVPDKATVWSVFSRDGHWKSELRLPERFLPMEVGHDYVAGAFRDSVDEVEVLVFELLKR